MATNSRVSTKNIGIILIQGDNPIFGDLEVVFIYNELEMVFVYNKKSDLSPYVGIIPTYGDLDCCISLVFIYKQGVLLPVLICRFHSKICQLKH